MANKSKMSKNTPAVKNPQRQKKRKNKLKGDVVMNNSDGTVSHIPRRELPKLRREARMEQIEQIVALGKPNTVYLTSSDFPPGMDLNWREVAESILAAIIASTNVSPPIGPAAIIAYFWWFMIDKLRSVGGLYPEPTTQVVPTFPANGNIPSGWAKFVEYLMPYTDPQTMTTYQFRYQYIYGIPAGSTTPATTSAVLNPSAPPGDFSFSALQNFFLVPSPIPPQGNPHELTWTFVNNPFNFQTDVVANNGDISQWVASTGAFTEAFKVPPMAPDASAIAIPYAHNVNNNFNPGVYCQSRHFDPEMACIIHPPQTNITLNQAAFTNIAPFDWKTAPLPQSFNAAPVKTYAPTSNLAQPGQLELIVNFGYITHNTAYVIGNRFKYLKLGQRLWPNLNSYCPFLYPLNNMGYHQAEIAMLNAVSVASSNIPVAGEILPGIYNDAGDYMTLLMLMEAKYIARTTEYAYMGLIFNTNDDICSQTQFASEFRNAAQNAILEDMLDTWAPTVRHGRLVVYYQDYRPVTAYGMTNSVNLAGVNTVASRWVRIGDDFSSAVSNINDYAPLAAGVDTGYAIGPYVFNQQQTGAAAWLLRGAGQTPGAPGFSQAINSVNLGQTFPLPPVYALGNTVGPAAPCLYGTKIILKAMEIVGVAGLGTWVSFNYAKLGGYCNQTQVGAIIEPDTMVVSTSNAVVNYINVNFKYVPTNLGSYFPLDKESVGRSLAYSPRISFNDVADRFPSLQAIGGNSSVQDALVANTQMGQGSNYNRMVQAKMEQGLQPVEACRSALGAYHVDIIPNFAGEEMVTWKAVELIHMFKRFTSVAPYHTEHAASLTSYNSPNIFDDFFRTILDVGERVIGGIGGLISSVTGGSTGNFIGEVAGSALTSLFFNKMKNGDRVSHFSAAKSDTKPAKLPAQFNKIITRVRPVDKAAINRINDQQNENLAKKFAKLAVKRDPYVAEEISPDHIANMVLSRLSSQTVLFAPK